MRVSGRGARSCLLFRCLNYRRNFAESDKARCRRERVIAAGDNPAKLSLFIAVTTESRRADAPARPINSPQERKFRPTAAPRVPARGEARARTSVFIVASESRCRGGEMESVSISPGENIARFIAPCGFSEAPYGALKIYCGYFRRARTRRNIGIVIVSDTRASSPPPPRCNDPSCRM